MTDPGHQTPDRTHRGPARHGRLARHQTGQQTPRRAARQTLDRTGTRRLHPSQTADRTPQPPAREQTLEAQSAGWLSWVPPVAALGTAFVLQVVLITDLLGEVLAERQTTGEPWVWYLIAGLFGVAVASSLEGSVAYLMRLYDLHMMARDSVWVLRLGMVLYVAGSAALIHWWLSMRGLPELIAWMLAAMSGSALFLWSRGSRWRNRRAMLAAGQIDPAMVRLPMSSKLLHPVRSLITVWLISWGRPVRTVDAARRRYDAWRRLRLVRRAGRRTRDMGQTPAHTPEQTPDREPSGSAVADQPQTPRQTAPDAPRTGQVSVNGSRPRQTTPPPQQTPTTPAPQRPRQTRSASNVRPLRSGDDDAVLRKLREWQTAHGQTPSIRQVQQLAGGGKSRAVRLRSLLSDDDQEVETWAG